MQTTIRSRSRSRTESLPGLKVGKKRLLPLIEHMLNEKLFIPLGFKWLDKEQKTFRLPWKVKKKSTPDGADAKVIEYIAKNMSWKGVLKDWKASLRNDLNNLKDFEEVGSAQENKNYKDYRIVDRHLEQRRTRLSKETSEPRVSGVSAAQGSSKDYVTHSDFVHPGFSSPSDTAQNSPSSIRLNRLRSKSPILPLLEEFNVFSQTQSAAPIAQDGGNKGQDALAQILQCLEGFSVPPDTQSGTNTTQNFLHSGQETITPVLQCFDEFTVALETQLVTSNAQNLEQDGQRMTPSILSCRENLMVPTQRATDNSQSLVRNWQGIAAEAQSVFSWSDQLSALDQDQRQANAFPTCTKTYSPDTGETKMFETAFDDDDLASSMTAHGQVINEAATLPLPSDCLSDQIGPDDLQQRVHNLKQTLNTPSLTIPKNNTSCSQENENFLRTTSLDWNSFLMTQSLALRQDNVESHNIPNDAGPLGSSGQVSTNSALFVQVFYYDVLVLQKPVMDKTFTISFGDSKFTQKLKCATKIDLPSAQLCGVGAHIHPEILTTIQKILKHMCHGITISMNDDNIHAIRWCKAKIISKTLNDSKTETLKRCKPTEIFSMSRFNLALDQCSISDGFLEENDQRTVGPSLPSDKCRLTVGTARPFPDGKPGAVDIYIRHGAAKRRLDDLFSFHSGTSDTSSFDNFLELPDLTL